LGLTILEARVYLALAKAGKATIATISKTSKVARPDVYRTLAKMQEKGLVEKILAIPTQFKLIPMKQSLLTLLENKRNEFLEVQEKTTELFLNFKENNSKSTLREDEAQLRLISEQATVRREKGVLDAVQRSFDEVTRTRLCLLTWMMSLKPCKGVLKFELSSTNLTKKYYQTS